MKYWGIFLLFSLNLWAQSSKAKYLIEGKIFDQASQSPLEMVYIVVVETQEIFFTDKKGSFNLAITEFPITLSVQYLGYDSQKIWLTYPQYLNIELQANDLNLEEVVLKAYKGEQKFLELPAPVSFLSSKDIANNNNTNIVSALNQHTGVFMHSGALNTNRLTIRGIGSRSLFSTTKIRAYFNDIPLSSGEVETTIEDIDPALLERVEIIKGPAASLYGANLGGVLQLIGKKPDYNTQQLQTHFTVGSFGLLKNATSFQMSKPTMNLTFAYQSLHSDGYRDNNEYNRQAFTTLGSFYMNPKTTLNLLTSLIDLKAFIPSSLGQTNYDKKPTKAAFTWGNVQGFEDYQKGLIGIGLQHSFNNYFKISSNIFSNFKNSYELRPFNILRENNIAYGNRTLLSYQNLTKPFLKIIVGSEVFHEKYDWSTYEVIERNTGDILSNNAEIREAYNVFGQIDLEIEKTQTQIVAGLNYGNLSYQLQDFYAQDSLDLSGQYSFDPQWSPRLAIRQSLKKNTAIYTTLSHGYSPPSLSETLTPDGQINLDIQPETGYNYELGIRGNYLNRHWWVDASVFYMPIRNLIIAQRIAEDQYQGQNAGKTNHIGLEFSSRYHLVFKGLKNLKNAHLSFAYTYADYRFKEFVNNEVDFADKRLPGIAPHRLNIGLDWEWKWGWYGNVQYQYVDEMPMNDANDLNAQSYSLLNLKTGFKKEFKNLFRSKKKTDNLEIDIYLGINNILNQKYASMILVNATAFGNNEARYYYPGLPINYYGGVKLKWGF